MRLRPTHLRTRLTAWYVAILATLLILAWAGTAALVYWQLRSQLDHFAVQEIETVEGLFVFAADGQLHLREEYHNHPESKNVIERYLEVQSPDGSILLRNDRLANRPLGGAAFPGEGVGGYSERSVQLSDGTRIRLVSRVHTLDGHRLLIRLGHSEEPLYATLRQLLFASILVLPLILAVAGFAGYGLARRALAPIEEMARQAREITPEKLHARLPNNDADDELGQLARVFNETLTRLERAFQQLRQFTSDASHELRTPLAMIRSVGEVGLQKDSATPTDYRDIIGSMLEEVNRLTSLIDSLLTISRADSGHIQLHRATIPVMPLVREAANLLEILLEEKSLRLHLEGDESVEVEGDPLFLRQALVNVLHNAVKYSPVGETISIRIKQGATIEIEDHGPGIPAADQARVFDRFYRVEKARGREQGGGGAGLGLAISKWAVEAQGGSITLESSPDRGCIFRIHLPRHDPVRIASSRSYPEPWQPYRPTTRH